MSAGFRAPAPPLNGAGALSVLVSDISTALTHGRYAGCCVCNRSCWTWWSPAPPSGYVPLHEGCALRLIEHWRKVAASGVAVVADAPDIARMGAYARKVSAPPPVAHAGTTATVVLTGGRAAILPDGFTPGPFWQPGDSEHTPWVTLAETAAGHLAYPAEGAEVYARATCTLLRCRGKTDRGIPVVGVSVIGPDGTVANSWGSPPTPGEPRWLPITQVGEWTRCMECSEVYWPGSWMNFMALTCLSCLAERETNDPRPPLFQPAHPGERYVPERFTKQVKPLRPRRSPRRH